MPDIFYYNSGSLFQALNPTETLVDLTDEPFIANIVDVLQPVVSGDGKVYGVPAEAAMGGGILYNKKIYEDLGLSVPKTWDEFVANNEKIKAAGKAPVVRRPTATRGLAAVRARRLLQRRRRRSPTSPRSTPPTRRKYADHARRRCRASSTCRRRSRRAGATRTSAPPSSTTACSMLADGEGAQYPMLTFAVGDDRRRTIPDNLEDIGFFGQPGDDAADERRDDLDAGRDLHPPRPPRHHWTQAKEFWRSSHRPRAREAMQRGRRRRRPVRDQGLRRCRTTCRRRSRTSSRTSTAERPRPALEFLSPIKGPYARADHRRGRLRHPHRPRMAPRCTTRTSRSRPSSSGFPGW